MDDSYFIQGKEDHPGHSWTPDQKGYMVECRKCKLKILVEMWFFGVPHNSTPSVVCADCLDISDKFREQNPEIAKKLDEWKFGQENAVVA